MRANLCDHSSRHPYKDLPKAKELTHYVNFVADDAIPLNIDIIKKATKTDKLLHKTCKISKTKQLL